jgi:uncharacterized protein YndB with AHSA1/START domain
VGAIEVRRTVATPLPAVWDTLTDFADYGRYIPMTRLRVDPGPVRPGWGFGGLTGLGPVGFLDSMLVVRWEPPVDGAARFAVRKTGRLLAGWADVRLTATQDGGTDVSWREEIVPRPLVVGHALAPVSDRLTARLFARALDGMLAAAAARSGVG